MDLRALAATHGDVQVSTVHIVVALIAACHVVAVCLWAHLNLRAPAERTARDAPQQPAPAQMQRAITQGTTRRRPRSGTQSGGADANADEGSSNLRARLAALRAKRSKAAQDATAAESKKSQ